MIKSIVSTKDQKLRIESKEVVVFDKKVKNLIRDLKDTLAVQKDPEGVGLAAPQIGTNLRVFVVNYKNLQRVVVNPKILEIDNLELKENRKGKISKNEILEGCLSLPYYYGPLRRSSRVKIKYLNQDGQEVIEEFKNFDAQIILHEIDHLNGVLFVDRLLEQKGKLYKLSKNDEWEEVEI